jgi:hypothetical protein
MDEPQQKQPKGAGWGDGGHGEQEEEDQATMLRRRSEEDRQMRLKYRKVFSCCNGDRLVPVEEEDVDRPREADDFQRGVFDCCVDAPTGERSAKKHLGSIFY